MCNAYKKDFMFRMHTLFVFCVFLILSASTVIGADFQNPSSNNNFSNNYDTSGGSGSVSIDSVAIVCGEGKANVYVTYSLADVSSFLYLFFGSSSIERAIMDIIGFTDAHFVSVGADEAELVLTDIATVYGNGMYWLPAHTFQTMIPTVEIITPQEKITYHNIMELSGIAYYAPQGSFLSDML